MGTTKEFFKFYYYLLTGTEHVVLGDLVYCKENETEKERRVGNAECEDEGSPDTLDSHQLDEIASTDLPNERNNLVKVRSSVLALYLFKLLYYCGLPTSQVGNGFRSIYFASGCFLTACIDLFSCSNMYFFRLPCQLMSYKLKELLYL